MTADHFAYVDLTSGTTGKPKGVMVQHDTWMSVGVCWLRNYDLAEGDVRLLQMASVSFDVFAGDLARMVFSGGTMVICPADVRVDIPALYRLISRERISVARIDPCARRSIDGVRV